MLTKGDDYPIHQTPEPIAFAGTDRNFYDRYFFDGFSTDGDLFLAAGLAVYPQLNIMDAAFGVRFGGRQYSLRASRHMGCERLDTTVGPIRVEVLEPLARIRLTVDKNPHGIAADLTFEGRFAPFEEPRVTRRTGTRLLMDSTRMTQPGAWSGWVRAGGEERRFAPGELPGARDRSWGIRGVGARDPQPPAPAVEPQFHWFWVPAVLEDRVLLFYVNEDEDGAVWNGGLTIADDDGAVRHLRGAAIDAPFAPGSRWPSRGTITATDGAGGAWRIDIEPGRRFYMSGIGYMHPVWGHGVNQGALATSYDEIDTDTVTAYELLSAHTQATARITLTAPEGRVSRGHGAFESLSMGPHRPRGLTGLFDAP